MSLQSGADACPVAPQQSLHDFLVVGHRPCPIFPTVVTAKADPLHAGMQAGMDRTQNIVAGKADDFEVHLLVETEVFHARLPVIKLEHPAVHG